MTYRMVCEACGQDLTSLPLGHRCTDPPGRLVFEYEMRAPRRNTERRGMWAYIDRLPVSDPANIVSLAEGGTPLVSSRSGLACDLWWKLEALNPTGSHKDRALSLTVTKAVELGASRIVITSTGSAGLSCAAYAARAGLPSIVVVPVGTPEERLRPMSLLGARVVELKGTTLDMERLLEHVAGEAEWCDATTRRLSNPFHSEATKTIAYEIVADAVSVPDWIVVPIGGGGTFVGIWQGLCDLKAMGKLDRLPRLAGVQPDRFNTLEVALERGLASREQLEAIAMDESVETVMRNLKHGVAPDGVDVLAALRESDGIVISVSDAQALAWQTRIAQRDGLFCEPSSSASGAAAEKLVDLGLAGPDDMVVGLITGSGFRETGTLASPPRPQLEADAGLAELEAVLYG